MKNIFPIVLLTLAVLGCDISKFVNSGRNDNGNTPKPSPTSEAKHTPEPRKAESTPASTLAPTLKKWEGKYPTDVKLFDNEELRSRLKKLLGDDYSDLRFKFNVETPIEIEKGIFKASACEAHNCGSNTYYIFVDIQNDNVNVYHLKDGGKKTYFENGKFSLPKNFADELVGDQ